MSGRVKQDQPDSLLEDLGERLERMDVFRATESVRADRGP